MSTEARILFGVVAHRGRTFKKEVPMSADNGIYVAEFPTKSGGKEWRVAHGFESVILELEEHWYSPSGYALAVKDIWDGPVFTDVKAAREEAFRLHDDYGWTEYGIMEITMSVPWGEEKET
jgi:hypothetical protein